MPMTALLRRLPAYKQMILRCIETSATPDDIMVCQDLINLFSDRFKPLLKYEEFVTHSMDLYSACEARHLKIIEPK
jgi:hypothetical protein